MREAAGDDENEIEVERDRWLVWLLAAAAAQQGHEPRH